jgi:hypothetical protein
MKMKHDHAAILFAAHELIEQYGGAATSIAHQRATRLGESGSSSAHDMALLVLSAVEELTSGSSGDTD